MEERVYGNRYRVTEKIGSGGMADVYKAQDQVLGRTVAVKVLHPRYAADPTFVARFRQEAQAAANLSNPHIVNIYDWGQEDSTYFIVMEYVRGTDLKTLVDEKGPLDPTKAAEYAAQVCQALAVAHGYDIVHRDIKPHNIVLTPDGAVKVMDFGIARAGNTTMTQTGSVLGTAQYISPEQAQGRPIGPSSDLYSLGVVLYELTTGRLPFEGDTPVAVALKQVNEQPVPPRRINPAIPPALEAVILHAMVKDPAERYASADEMRDDLRRVIAGQPVAAVPSPMGETSVMPAVTAGPAVPRVAAPVEQRRGRAAWAWVIALITLVLIGGLLAWAVFAPKTVPVPDVTGLPLAQAQTAITNAGLKIGKVNPQNSESVPQGSVISESPPPRTPIAPGTAVDLVVSAGVKKVSVPDLSGLTQADAFAALQNAGLKLQSPVNQEFSKAKAGTVTTQTPAPGTSVPSGSFVSITVSQGVKTATVPSVAGKSVGAARSALENLGFAVSVKRQSSDTVPKDAVIDSDPSAGTAAPVGSTVTLFVSNGPALATVPDLRGMTPEEAKAALEAKGLALDSSLGSTTTTDTALFGRVVAQDPLPLVQKPKGTVVHITLGTS